MNTTNLMASRDRQPALYYFTAIVILSIVALTYWKVLYGNFIWDDINDIQQSAWLRQDGGWYRFFIQNASNRANYFRPLVFGLYAIQARIFNVMPGPMHAVSLVFHLINTFLVGILALRICRGKLPASKLVYAFAIPMLLYGLHPMLVECVAWIGCQFDVVSMMFMLLGWVANTRLRNDIWRAVGVALCFFLGACSKESTAAFPFILVLFDWYAIQAPRSTRLHTQLRELLNRNARVYALTFIAGVAYLAIRHRALGDFVASNSLDHMSMWMRYQEIAFIYMRYWRMFFWPTIGMGPVHPVSTAQFLIVDGWSLLKDATALAVVTAGVLLTLRRRYVGGLIVAVTLALLPVLHLIGVAFDASLFHERYAMPGLAMLLVWLPLVLWEIPMPASIERVTLLASVAALIVWTALAVLNVRLLVPLWSSQVTLWEWTLRENPTSIEAKDELISAYIDKNDDAKAWILINQLVADDVYCVNCMLNAASLAINEGNVGHASFFLEKVKNARQLYMDRIMYRFYLTLIGKQLILMNKPTEAEQAARGAINIDNLDSRPQIVLATALALEGKFSEAEQTQRIAINLLPPDERAHQQQAFDDFIHLLQAPSAEKRDDANKEQ